MLSRSVKQRLHQAAGFKVSRAEKKPGKLEKRVKED